MKTALWVVLLLALPALAGCTVPPRTELPHISNPFVPSGGSPSLRFLTPVDLPQSARASEPSIAVDGAGIIYVSAPQGLPSASPLWQSTDGGATWTILHPNSATAGSVGLGGGDTSIALARDGAVYVTDLWAGSATISSSHDKGKTWFTSPIASEVPYYDREWNTVDAHGTAYFLGRTFTPGQAAWVSRSTDGGKTWAAAGNPWINTDTSSEFQDGPLVVNPKTDALAVVYSCGTGSSVCVSTSKDQGLTWASSVAAKADGPVGNDFPALAADVAGTWYVAYSIASAEGSRVWMTTSSDAKTWSAPVPVSSASGNALFPWIVAGDAGRVAIAWYGTTTPGDSNDAPAMKDATWDVYVAQSLDAAKAAPTFETARVTPSAIHSGTISTRGLDPTSPQPADRSLGDFFTIALDPKGRVNLAFVRSIDGQVTTQWTRQDAGEPLYEGGVMPTLPTPKGNATLLPGGLT